MAKRTRLLLFLCFSFSLSYFLHRPLPSTLAEPWATRKFLFVMDSVHRLAGLGETFGFGNVQQNFRNILDFLAIRYSNHSRSIPESLTITDAVFDDVPVRIYRPPMGKDKKMTGAIVFYHGGGWIFGSIETYQQLTAALANKTGVPLVSVGYRLSPEFKYPVPLDDCVAATSYFMKHAKDYNVDPKRIVIAGDSAGGNLAAAVALRLTSKKPPLQPVAQVLIYPVLQAFDFKLPSHLQNDIFVTSKGLARIVLLYLGLDESLADPMAANNHTTAAVKARHADVFDVDILPEQYRSNEYRKSVHDGIPEVVRRVQEKILDPYFAPLMASADLVRRLPSAYVLTAGHDALRDDGFLYADKLRRHGVEVRHVDYPGAYHPFLMHSVGPHATELSARALDELVDYVKKKLGEK